MQCRQLGSSGIQVVAQVERIFRRS